MRGRTWGTAWRETVGPQVATVITTGQSAAAQRSSVYIAAALAELDMRADSPTEFNPDSLAGVTGGGVEVADAAYQAVVTTAKAQYAAEADGLSSNVTIERALAAGEDFITTLAASMMADAMRGAEQVAMAQRPWVEGYVRIVEPGACSRCIVLAGKFYLFNEGFLRHPRCRCNHVPAPPDKARLASLMATESPERLFDSLTEAEQDRIFTQAGAEAIRLGADIGRVVNARKGMSRAQDSGRLRRVNVNGREVYTTTAGTTRRGRRRNQTSGVRLMPESILEIAGNDRDEVLRLLRLHGYIT